MTTPELRLIPGGGEMVETLDDVANRVRTGEVVGLVVCLVDSERGVAWTWSHRDELPAAWAQLLASVSTAQHDLINQGLVA